MEGEHFGIAPVEGLASGCVTVVHNSGGMREFIPPEYRWETYEDLKTIIVKCMESEAGDSAWEVKRRVLWGKIGGLTSDVFEEKIWDAIHSVH